MGASSQCHSVVNVRAAMVATGCALLAFGWPAPVRGQPEDGGDDGSEGGAAPWDPSAAGGPDGRVWPETFEVDLAAAGAGYAWIPEDIPYLDMSTEGYAAWSVDLHLNIGGYFRLRRGYYESNGLAAPVSERASLADSAGDDPLLVAVLALAGGLRFDDEWDFELFARHDRQVYRSTVRPREPTLFVPSRTSLEELSEMEEQRAALESTRPVRTFTAFDTTIIGALFDVDALTKEGLAPQSYVGFALTSYQKPYMLHRGDEYVRQYLFDAGFSGLGVGIGAIRDARMTDDVDALEAGLSYEARLIVGFGQVQLLDDLELGEALEQTGSDQGVGYLQGYLAAGYFYRFVQDDWVLALGGDARFALHWFFLYDKGDDGGQQDAAESTLNYDIVLGGQGRAVLGF